jgi:N-acetylmuramoyl-L-alanine amidase
MPRRLHFLSVPFVHLWFLLLLGLALPACSPAGRELRRHGDEIMVAGRLFRTGTPVVLWTDPGGYDHSRTEKRFVPWDQAAWRPPPPKDSGERSAGGPATPNRFGVRFAGTLNSPESPLSADEFEQIRGGGWDLPLLQRVVDQFVLHYDVSGVSRSCFRTLHDHRGLSIHFMIDIDGTVYQAMDLKERAWHATTSNDRSIGVEIANVGAYADNEKDPFARWYAPDPDRPGAVRITVPPELGDGGVRTPGFVGRPRRDALVVGEIQGRTLRQYDYTPEQYEALARLTAALCTIFPNMPADMPRDEQGQPVTGKLPDDQLRSFRGILGHYHIQSNKVDPGPALDWDWLLREARRRVGRPPRPEPEFRRISEGEPAAR